MNIDPRMEVLHIEERGFIGMTFNEVLGLPELHIDIPIWDNDTISRYNQLKKCAEIFGNIQNELRSRGIKKVVGLAETDKEIKFDMIFGFKPTDKVALDASGTAKRILTLEI